MPRPPKATDKQKKKTFLVAAGNAIYDNNSIRRNAGEEIELTHAQAVHFKNLGQIEVPLEDFGGEEDDNDTVPSGTAGQKAGGTKAEGSGKSAGGDSDPRSPSASI